MPRSSTRASSRTAYHHGDLRQALVDGALALLSETQSWDFSLREVARRAEVSHNAPYWHFPDKRALLTAVAAAGFVQLRASMLAAAADAPTANEALAGIGFAYVTFGAEKPALYRLMFDSSLMAFDGAPAELAEAAAASRGVLIDIVRRGAQDGALDVASDDPQALGAAALAAWSLVHGLTTLFIDGLATLDGPRALREMLAEVSGVFMRGLAKRKDKGD